MLVNHVSSSLLAEHKPLSSVRREYDYETSKISGDGDSIWLRY